MLNKIRLAIFIVSLVSILPIQGEEFSVIEDKAKLVSPAHPVQKIKLKLKNNLEAYIVSDPASEQSAASLTVLAGSWEDPKEHPGIAHFLEHMLFLGTKNFPDESEFDRFVSEHGGTKNAYTTNDNTTFFVSSENSAFEECLKRFSDFFKDPLFNPSGVNRELQAIDQEYAKNIDKDEIRLMQVLKELSNPDHPYHNFSMGNSKTLSGVDQETLKEWYRKHYSANLMRLAIVSPLPLETLKEWVVRHFGDIPNHDRPEMEPQPPLFGKDVEGKVIYIEPIKNKRTLTLLWDLPSPFAEMQDTKPDMVVCHLLGHEGEGSLLEELKKEKLAEGIRCGSDHLSRKSLEMYLQIDLTDEGVKKVDEVIMRCFQAIALYKKRGMSDYLFDELKRTSTLEYQYKQRETAGDRILELAMLIPYEEMETFPENSYVIKRADEQKVKELINYLTPNNSLIVLMAPASLTGIATDRKEKWIGVPYTAKDVPEKIWKGWLNAEPFAGIEFPVPNPYIPSDITLLAASSEPKTSILPLPQEILRSEKGIFYFAQDTRFQSPKICWIFQIKIPAIIQGNALSVVMGDFYEKWITNALSPESYPAAEAGLNYQIKRTENGLSIEIEGYSENAALLLDNILKKLLESNPTKEEYQLVRASLHNTYQDASMDSPYEQALESAQSLMYKFFTTDQQKVSALRRITFEKFQQFCGTLFDRVYIEGMLYGNMNLDQAKKVSKDVVDTFTGGAYQKEQQLKQEAVVLPEKEGPYYIENKLTVQGNTTLLALEMPTYSFKSRGAQQIMMQGMGDAFFAELRTKQQTGYLVFSAPLELERRLFNIFIVQSNTHDVRDLLARFELFLERYLQEIQTEISEERFDKIRLSSIEALMDSAPNTKTMTELLNLLAFKYDADFRWVDERVDALQSLSYAEFLTLLNEFIGRENRRRFALLLQGTSAEEPPFRYKQLPSLQRLRSLSSY